MTTPPPKLCVTYATRPPPLATLFVLALPREKKEVQLEVKVGVSDAAATADATADATASATLTVDSQETTVCGSDVEVAAAICRSIPSLRPLLAEPASELNFWLSFAEHFGSDSCSPQKRAQLLKALDGHLRLRTFLIGHRLSLADVAVFAASANLLGLANLDCSFNETADAKNFSRWLRLMRFTNGIAPKTLKSFNASLPGLLRPMVEKPAAPGAPGAGAGKLEKEKEKASSCLNLYEGKLPGAVLGKVVTRFPPEPSGYLHIGHAKAALLNDYYARSYQGRLVIRFDDTNPARENQEFEQAILEDLEMLGIKGDGPVTHTSDYFDFLQQLCERLIREGLFYCDSTPLEQMRAERGEGIEPQCRGNSVEENLRRWEEMKSGSEEGAKNCVRAKIDMKSKNKCLRDPVMYRVCLDPPHHRHGTKYKVYPMYDFACPVVDSLEGITHAMRTNEYADRIPQYHWVTEAAKMNPVIIYEFSRLNFVYTVLSKRKLTWLVDTGVVTGWDDPRFPTVRGILRRGLTVQALREFLFEQGPSKNANLMEWDKLWTKNKQIIDPIVPRYMGVRKAKGVPVRVLNGPQQTEERDRPLHLKNAEVGMGKTVFSSDLLMEAEDAQATREGEELTLMRWCNAVVKHIERDAANTVVRIDVELNPEGDFRKTERKLHWVSVSPDSHAVDVVLREYDHLILKPKPEEDDTMEQLVNRNSLRESVAVCENGISALHPGDMLQLERCGYFRVDQKKDGEMMVLVKIPDGRSKSK